MILSSRPRSKKSPSGDCAVTRPRGQTKIKKSPSGTVTTPPPSRRWGGPRSKNPRGDCDGTKAPTPRPELDGPRSSPSGDAVPRRVRAVSTPRSKNPRQGTVTPCRRSAGAGRTRSKNPRRGCDGSAWRERIDQDQKNPRQGTVTGRRVTNTDEKTRQAVSPFDQDQKIPVRGL